MDRKKICYTIPSPSDFYDYLSNIEVYGSAFIINFVYAYEGIPIKGGLRFDDCQTYRYRIWYLCSEWHIKDAYLTLAKVINSSWINELKIEGDKTRNDFNLMNHYIIFLENIGCYEIISKSWEALPIKEGHWTDH